MYIKLIAAGVLSLSLFGSGFWVGTRVEVANQVDKVNDALSEQRSAFEVAAKVKDSFHQLEVNTLKASIRRAENRAERNQEVATEELQRSQELRERIDDLVGRFSGDSVCSLASADVLVLHEAIEAANASISVWADGVPGAGEDRGSGEPEG